MQTEIDRQRQELMEVGYVVVRDLIPPAELQALRQSADAIVDRAPAAGRVTMTDWVDRASANAVEFCFGDRTLDFSRQLMEVPDVAPLGMWILCGSGTGWHRDIHPIDMAPLDGLQEDVRLNGPPYLQWNIALYDDSYLQVITGSHQRRNNPGERTIERSMGVVPLPGATVVDLEAGDGVVYINNILHSATPNGDEKRRTLHLGYQAFGGQGFTHFFLPATLGVHFIEYIAPRAAEQCVHFEKLHAQRQEGVASVLRAIIDADRSAFMAGLYRIHHSQHARMTTLVVLSKIACLIHNAGDAENNANGPCIQHMADRFTGEELEALWRRFQVLDGKLQADTEHYES
ncbi:MAG: hypothetical protein VX293_11730, partial [Candidatus Latescibacterota bacterium]|nr:hypothetical protein [Candidatus Latescibacterota bacterium]